MSAQVVPIRCPACARIVSMLHFKYVGRVRVAVCEACKDDFLTPEQIAFAAFATGFQNLQDQQIALGPSVKNPYQIDPQ